MLIFRSHDSELFLWVGHRNWLKKDQKSDFFKSIQTFSTVSRQFWDRLRGPFTNLNRFVRQERARRENREKSKTQYRCTVSKRRHLTDCAHVVCFENVTI